MIHTAQFKVMFWKLWEHKYGDEPSKESLMKTRWQPYPRSTKSKKQKKKDKTKKKPKEISFQAGVHVFVKPFQMDVDDWKTKTDKERNDYLWKTHLKYWSAYRSQLPGLYNQVEILQIKAQKPKEFYKIMKDSEIFPFESLIQEFCFDIQSIPNNIFD